MYYALAAVLFVIGFFVFGTGIVAGADPEGRGGNLLFLIPVGFLVMAIAFIWLCYMAGRSFGWW